MFEAAEIEHPNTAICAAAYENVDALGAEADVENFFVVGDQLGFRCQGRDIPDRAGGVDARRDDQTGRDYVPVERGDRRGMFGRL